MPDDRRIRGAETEPDKGTVLLVDDEDAILRVVAGFLRLRGFTVLEARSGWEAMRAFDPERIDVVITDINMPDYDGLALLRTVTARNTDVPVILMTGGPTLESAVKAVEYQAFCYLIKPFSTQQLFEKVKQALNLRRLAALKRQALALSGLQGGLTQDLKGLQASFERMRKSFTLAFQPIFGAQNGEIFGHEALLRSESPLMPHPNAVLQAAERLGRTDELGQAIRERAVAPMRSRLGIGTLFINLHPRDLMDAQLYDPEAPLSQFAPYVVLEITERASLEEVSDLPDRVSQLRKMGFRIAVDDLGSGYAGLSSFVALQPEIVKLDISLVRHVDREPLRRQLVRSLTELCRKMDIRVVAEGIETEAERDVLTELDCDLLQGFLLGRPGALPSSPQEDFGDQRAS